MSVTEERKIGKKYARLLQIATRNAIKKEGASFGTLALKTKVGYRIKDQRLQRLVLTTPKHSFIHHYGFEGIRKNGRELSLKAKEHLADFKQVAVLNDLAADVANVRGDQVIAQINFK